MQFGLINIGKNKPINLNKKHLHFNTLNNCILYKICYLYPKFFENKNVSVSVSPAVIFGSNQKGLGVNVNETFQYERFNATLGAHFMSYGLNYGDGGIEGMEYWALGYDNGTISISYSSSYYQGGGISQQLGAISIRHNDFSFTYQNDYMFGLPADGGDRYRTAAAQVGWRDFSAGVNLFTGDPGLYGEDRETKMINGKATYIMNKYGDKGRSNAIEFSYRDLSIGTHLFTNKQVLEEGATVEYGEHEHWSRYKNKRKFGKWDNGQVYSSPLYLGIRYDNQVARIGYSHKMFQDGTQNFMHKKGFPFLTYLNVGFQNYYLGYNDFYTGMYYYSGWNNPYSIWGR